MGGGRPVGDVLRDGRLPIFRSGVWEGGVGRGGRPEITADDVRMAAPEAEAELAVGFFGSRYERATPAEREYLRAMADAAYEQAPASESGSEAYGSTLAIELDSSADGGGCRGAGEEAAVAVAGAGLADEEGLVYSSERGRIAFTVPHFGRYLRSHPD